MSTSSAAGFRCRTPRDETRTGMETRMIMTVTTAVMTDHGQSVNQSIIITIIISSSIIIMMNIIINRRLIRWY